LEVNFKILSVFAFKIIKFNELRVKKLPPLYLMCCEFFTHLGGHMLMGTDAPKSMGFTVRKGNNSYICLSPDTRAETKRWFDALSADGKVTMNLQDMFWGSYFGDCTDKFCVQWMFDCVAKV
jgi:uncharacterized glyoxalase superfamily protein PhnB